MYASDFAVAAGLRGILEPLLLKVRRRRLRGAGHGGSVAVSSSGAGV